MNTRVLGIDPGLCNTGWGVIERYAYRTTWIAHGVIKTRSEESLPDRLIFLNREMDKVMQTYHPHAFDMLNARGIISVTERALYVQRIRALAKACCEVYIETSRSA